MTRYIILSALIILLLPSVHASAFAPIKCSMKENINISISFNGTIDTASKVQSIITDKNNKVLSLAKDAGVKDIKLKSQNFNVNYNNNTQSYNYSASSNFVVKTQDKSFLLLDKLKENNFQSSMSVNRYSQGNCN